VKAQRRRGVEIEIDVMRKMEPPELRRAMHQDVPEVERVVHQHHRKRHFELARHRQLFEQPPPAALDNRNEGSDQRPLGDLQRNRAQSCEGKISYATPELRFNRPAQGPEALEPD
jgi:hypothetical protein